MLRQYIRIIPLYYCSNMGLVTVNTQVLFVKRPVDQQDITESFKVTTGPIPRPTEGQILVQGIYPSVDPGTRTWMEDNPRYSDLLTMNEVMVGNALAEVIESRNNDYKAGDIVTCFLDWQKYAAVDTQLVRRLLRSLYLEQQEPPVIWHCNSLKYMAAMLSVLLEVWRNAAIYRRAWCRRGSQLSF
ncbi:chaperonin 10-like protein [Syncephalis fuscata]|nr:chaperonin 10-like protein [Syncephalis fuscata]